MRLLSTLFALAAVAPLSAQTTTLRASLEPFSWMVGNWEGPATIMMGPEGTRTLRQTERVEIEAGGTAIAVRGRGFERVDGGGERVTFEAFAVIYQGRDNQPQFRAWTTEGYVDPSLELTQGGLIWSFPHPRGGTVRYTLTRTPDDMWHEVGHWSTDGKNWNQFMEMKLKRVGSGGADQAS